MASPAEASGGDHVVELTTCDASPVSEDAASPIASCEDRAPFLNKSDKKAKPKPKINIFSTASLRRPLTEEQMLKSGESNESPVTQFFDWLWSGSKYSGVLCVAFSSVIYVVMEVIAKVFTVQSIPLLETAFSRYTVFLVFSFWWLRKNEYPVFGPAQARNILGLRAIAGCLSVLSFVYCIQMAPLPLAVFLSFTTPIIAVIMARIILQEKVKFQDIGGLVCSFIGMLLIFLKALTTQGGNKGSHQQMYAIILGLLSSVAGGVSYCLIKLGAKECDQPVTTIFAFGILASPAAGICTLVLEDMVMPTFYSFSVMMILAALAFFAELFFAHGLQLELTGKAANIVYLEAALSQVLRMTSTIADITLGHVVGSLLILASVSYTLCIAPNRDTN